ncbi:MAG: hypothetical protein KIS67_24995 [Verrucomicrobiae bacterium]|nr:hypothetical protein [Verrucomicrobiae bacterium]
MKTNLQALLKPQINADGSGCSAMSHSVATKNSSRRKLWVSPEEEHGSRRGDTALPKSTAVHPESEGLAATEHKEHKTMNSTATTTVNRKPHEPRNKPDTEHRLELRPVLDCGSPLPLSDGHRFVQRLAKRQRTGARQDASRPHVGRSAILDLPSSILCFLLCLLSASAATRYVWKESPSSAPPYTSWATAAHVIQDAVDAADPGDTVLVTNGVYATGGKAYSGMMSNRVAVDKALNLRSVNGPEATIIQGYQVPGNTIGDGAIRCVYLTNGASLSGFTLTNGSAGGGAGVCCGSATASVSNCVIIGNSAIDGGGAYQGSLVACMLVSNVADFGGGAYQSALNDCTLVSNSASGSYGFGGGAHKSSLTNCVLIQNDARQGGGGDDCVMVNCALQENSAIYGGGAYDCILLECLLTGNDALSGGGACESTLHNCTLTANSADLGGGTVISKLINCKLSNNWSRISAGATAGGELINCVLIDNHAAFAGGAAAGGSLSNCTVVGNSALVRGGGVANGSLANCIVYFNTSTNGANHSGASFNYTCTFPLPTNGVGNIDLDPLFVDTNGWSNLRLQSNSPCINAGNNAYVTSPTDLDGNPRIVSGTADIGAYEYQGPGSVISYAWLQQYNLPTDGSADTLDSDQDGHNAWQEWKAWTDPTNPLSVLKLLTPQPDPNGMVVTWQSVLGHSYLLERATNASGPFSLLQGNIPGQAGTTSFTDTNTVEGDAILYRVAVPE